MTNSNGDRFDQIEALLSEAILVTRSNAKAIQALADRISEVTHIQEEAAEEREELRRATIGIANLLASLDEDRPTILRKLNSIENKLDRFLERRDGENSDG